MEKVLKIANAQAFWGDSLTAAAALIEQQPDINYITLDFLAEVSLSIMAAQRQKNPCTGYAQDFVEVIKSLIPYWLSGSKVKIVTNAGGLNPQACALACAEILRQAGCSLKIAVIAGDDVLEMIKAAPSTSSFKHMESGRPIVEILPKLVTANAYMGAKLLVEALKNGADIVITGRVADPSLTVAPCVAHFDWNWTDYNLLAQATIAGHLIECGTQVTGGISDDWLNLPDLGQMGFPIVEMSADGSFIITKPPNSGGRVSLETVKEQLLYEIGDPDRYLSPDATVSFLSLKLEEGGPNRVKVTGGQGSAPPATLKVSVTYQDGFKAEGMLAIVGRDVQVKARRCGEIILERLAKAGFTPERSCIECLGCGDVMQGVLKNGVQQPLECVLRICVADPRREVLEHFSREIAPMVTSGPPGTTGYTSGRPHIRPVLGYWPCLVDAAQIKPTCEYMKVNL
ncbi:MAG: DUF1446 domain-containing protein [Parachlamydiaceae bacterium]|nr:DUF1446 domain-containing protein [Parachlamydiaceae bacterium]